MITLKNEEEMMVWLFATNGRTPDGAAIEVNEAVARNVADYGDRMVEEYRKRIPTRSQIDEYDEKGCKI